MRREVICKPSDQSRRYSWPHHGNKRTESELTSRGTQHLQTCMYISRGITGRSIISEWESSCSCVMWGNMTTSCGGVNGKKNKQESQSYPVRFAKRVTLMSICTYDFTTASQSPHCSYRELTAHQDNARLCVWTRENASTVDGEPQDEGTSFFLNVSVSDVATTRHLLSL